MKFKLSQQEFRFVNWGGKRRGAGRKPKGEPAGVSHAKRPLLASRYPVLVTIARGLNKLWRRRGSVFSDRYHARILRAPREVRNALVYVLMNARKHDAWRVLRADPYSSGAWFDGWSSPLEHAGPPNVAVSSSRFLARPCTWLLSVGWLRHGRIDFGESPAAAA